MQSPVQGTVHRINGVHAVNLLSCLFRRNQAHRYMDPADDQHSIFLFHLAGHFRAELPIAGINLTRFQRASESAQHSAGGRRNNIVNRSSV
jgi:hypothetical protein